MQHKLKLLALLLLLASAAFAQKTELKTKFGKISDDEIKMSTYPADPDAPAVVLFDKGRVDHRYVSNVGFIQEFERHTRIKIFKKEAYGLADVSFFYYKWQKIGDLKAVCYTMENGKVVETELEKANIFDEKITKNRMLRKFSIPGVKEGAIIEFKYTITDEDVAGIPNWTFQKVNAPTVWSEYEATVPTFISYNKMSQGWEPFLVSEEKDINKSLNITVTNRGSGLSATGSSETVKVEYEAKYMHYIQQNLPAMKPEPYVSSLYDYLSQINFDIQAVYRTDLVPNGTVYKLINTSYKSYNNNWETLGSEMLEDTYDDYLTSTKYTKDAVKTTTDGKSTPEEKLAAIYEYIGRNYGVRDLDIIWITQSMETLTKDRKGTATDLNLLLINMLRQANIKAWPIMISTCSNGRVHPARVSPNAFDRVLAAVELEENKIMLVNVAAFPHAPGLLDKEDLNNMGLLLKSKQEVTWEPLQNKIASREATIATFDILPEGGISGNVSCMVGGYGTVDRRRYIAEKDAAYMLQTTLKEWATEGTFSDIQVDKPNEWKEPSMKTTFKVATPAFATVSGNKIYLSPTLGLGQKENPFKNPERKFSVDLGAPREESFNFTFNIPAGFKVEEAPKPAKITLGDNAVGFDYLIETNAQTVKIIIKTKIKKPFFAADEYENLRQFFTTMSAKLEEQIVLTKI